MQHRGVEYNVVQGLGRHIWKWSALLKPDLLIQGQAASKKEAIAEAERAIGRALAPKKIRLAPPDQRYAKKGCEMGKQKNAAELEELDQQRV